MTNFGTLLCNSPKKRNKKKKKLLRGKRKAKKKKGRSHQRKTNALQGEV